MARNGYFTQLSLADVFADKKANYQVLPQLVESHRKNSLLSDGTPKTFYRMTGVVQYCKKVARSIAKPYYEHMKVTSTGSSGLWNITLDGNISSQDLALVHTNIYNQLLASKSIMRTLVNNMEYIRQATAYMANQRKLGYKCEIYSRFVSTSSLKFGGKNAERKFLHDVMENIFYNPQFEELQRKLHLKKQDVGSTLDYDKRQQNWERKVGYQE